MSAEIANELSEKYTIWYVSYSRDIESHLNNSIKFVKTNVKSCLTIFGLGSYSIFDIVKLYILFKRIQPDLVIICQGTIEVGLKGMWASKLCRYKTISYIPLCYSFSEIKSFMGCWRDIIASYYYRVFDAIITISGEQKELLSHRVDKKVYILNNAVDGKCDNGYLSPLKKDEPVVIGIIGRISFVQKGQNKIIGIANKVKSLKINVIFRIIGDGEDADNMRASIRANGLDKMIYVDNWEKDRRILYKGINIVLITSNYEGVPLVMLESILFGKYVIAPNMGIFKEYLDKDFLYNSINDAAGIICRVIENYNEYRYKFDKSYRLVIENNNRETFRSNLFSIIDEITSN